MEQIIANLKSFNRKERFYLVGAALGNKEFTLSGEFKSRLYEGFDLNVPKDAFAAMDYHIDWIYASLFDYFESPKHEQKVFPNKDRIISANQEDVDFLVSYIENSLCHIIMLEAKIETGWTNKQMASKAKRLGKIFGTEGKEWANVIPHFAILSPTEPSQLKTVDYPSWMKKDGQLIWMELKPPPNNLRKIKRCDEKGRITEVGNYWRITR
jgi:hypothetical protein